VALAEHDPHPLKRPSPSPSTHCDLHMTHWQKATLQVQPSGAERFLSAANMFLERLYLEFGVREHLTPAAFEACLGNLESGAESLSNTVPPYSRKILLSSPRSLYSIVAITWPQGACTPVHSHYTWCTFMVVGGVLTERRFAAPVQDGALPHLGTATTLSSGEVRVDEKFGGIHQLANESNQEALSIHCYGVDGPRSATHVNRVYDHARTAPKQ
jgi:predicted metal-dependent enzyme (double-stranded beta helix superfamily)